MKRGCSMKKANNLINIIQDESLAYKFKMETHRDYQAFLMGKILITADQVDYARYQAAEKWVSSFHEISDMEEYLEDLLAEVEALEV